MTLYYNQNRWTHPETGKQIVQTHHILVSDDHPTLETFVKEEEIIVYDENDEIDEIYTKLILQPEIRKWLNENIGRNQWRFVALKSEPDSIFFFFNKENAMKFKLAWS